MTQGWPAQGQIARGDTTRRRRGQSRSANAHQGDQLLAGPIHGWLGHAARHGRAGQVARGRERAIELLRWAANFAARASWAWPAMARTMPANRQLTGTTSVAKPSGSIEPRTLRTLFRTLSTLFMAFPLPQRSRTRETDATHTRPRCIDLVFQIQTRIDQRVEIVREIRTPRSARSPGMLPASVPTPGGRDRRRHPGRMTGTAPAAGGDDERPQLGDPVTAKIRHPIQP
ncbi:hypothetical protein BCF44_13119 [Kutzneria buriramensis]|uniref:Uncharacterized protein n=1 Tax=Kutzneria buriramensis TaxID=1045776 RepID=A0A3E0GTB3_9PSEU|nr:hypothetical protein BCF44_13119 [Kutzneria buriramensis]